MWTRGATAQSDEHLDANKLSITFLLPENHYVICQWNIICIIINMIMVVCMVLWALKTTLKATLHTRLTSRDHCTSSTLISGKGGAGPSSLHTTLEGPTEYVNARWM